jgi:hypothetical protein
MLLDSLQNMWRNAVSLEEIKVFKEEAAPVIFRSTASPQYRKARKKRNRMQKQSRKVNR